jgi:aminopeptidase
MVAEECYRCGARKVTVDWTHQPLTKLNYQKRSVKTLSKMEDWEIEKLKHHVETLPVHIYLESDDPDGLRGINQEKVSKASQARYKIVKPFREAMDNKYQWCIAAVPGAAWAKKVFPGVNKFKAMEMLWEAILYTSRVDGNPVAAWEAHNKDLADRCAYLNSLGIETLEYHSANGTDLKVGMIEDALFMGGSELAQGSGIEFNPNIPSEEAFISPKKGVAEGIVYSSKPLSYRGELIENFSVRFEGGRAVEVHAERNEDLLRKMISMDEGAAYLGECALVPYDSPIRNSGILFYNTLFDENAACHLALGRGFTNVIKDYDKYTLEECYEKGINQSMIHVDFMIGTEDLSITAITRDGRRVPIFENGNWAF